MLTRVLEPETLDHLAADDPAAQRARRDLRRVNSAMGARRILERTLSRALPDGRRGLRLLEIGCGDGRLLLDVAKHRGDRWPDAHVDLLDRRSIVDAATVAAYTACGWQARPIAADVLDWARVDDGERWDAVVANLFLHHFDGASLRNVLAGCARRADALVACEPRRSRMALAATHSPQTLRRGNACCSTSATDQPARASSVAIALPAGPAPITAASNVAVMRWRPAARRTSNA